jgi:hypothetical protein
LRREVHSRFFLVRFARELRVVVHAGWLGNMDDDCAGGRDALGGNNTDYQALGTWTAQ